MISNADVNELQLEDVEDYATDYPPVGFPQAEENIHTTSAEEKPKYRRNKIIEVIRANKWVVGLVFIMMILLIVIIAIASGSSKNQPSAGSTAGHLDPTSKHEPPIVIDPTSLDPAVTDPLMESLDALYDRHDLDKSTLGPAAGETPQNKAFYWLATDENLENLDHNQRSQRFALAVLYYSTNAVVNGYATSPQPWVSAHLWLSKAHACEWKGIVCNSQQHIVGISLERNNLSGSLPKELGILGEKLTSLDLTSNTLHLEGKGFASLARLYKLETLLMDDNYLVYDKGLPFQIQNMENLQKLRLSYNLLSGVLEANHKVLSRLTKLTHLEIESNFLSGTMPDVVGEMSNLVYLYMRRNELSFNLDFLKTGKLTNLFALWLDNNDVTGTIPTEVGLLTNLASISITNSSLAGSIPSQLGDLEGLRRLWLYSNKLTGNIPPQLDILDQLQVLELHHNQLEGAMPLGVCALIDDCDYEFKSLTCDCNSLVQCATPDCCTECFD
eukprot:CAMPEP_0117029652 /NCGR_PEP_ID=MMETSP0472-20121206/21453_1 /TAXON_ID=693140 ORGANISM="Tiarina fusus, Strain LIS" /NCGR_SAMPLE_ID=MMETSP0472 /ASSEMBLY_ACC=CAM_ASM_000603 /LENGTH=499 /DNA_ID=CAMNT_0004737477 /DNA_START=74 /DNA_END=1573 /DNA_ORIENTATION=-